MDSLKDRGRNAEAQFHNGQLQKFKALRHRNYLFGLWITKLLNLTHDQEQLLLQDVVEPHLCTLNGEQLIATIMSMLNLRCHRFSELHLQKQLNYFHQDALMQFKQ